jgi:hypothetical protein
MNFAKYLTKASLYTKSTLTMTEDVVAIYDAVLADKPQ